MIRAFAFAATAVGVELARGPATLALLLALALGLLRWPFLAVVVAAVITAILSVALPESAETTGKVTHALSNSPFVLLIHVMIAAAGYAGGRIVRRFRSR